MLFPVLPEQQALFSLIISDGSFLALGGFLTHVHIDTLLNTQGGTDPLQICSIFSLYTSLLSSIIS